MPCRVTGGMLGYLLETFDFHYLWPLHRLLVFILKGLSMARSLLIGLSEQSWGKGLGFYLLFSIYMSIQSLFSFRISLLPLSVLGVSKSNIFLIQFSFFQISLTSFTGEGKGSSAHEDLRSNCFIMLTFKPNTLF